jgi:hypothetical protein
MARIMMNGETFQTETPESTAQEMIRAVLDGEAEYAEFALKKGGALFVTRYAPTVVVKADASGRVVSM